MRFEPSLLQAPVRRRDNLNKYLYLHPRPPNPYCDPPTPLPKTRRKPVPFHISFATPEALAASKGGVPEFNMQMAVDERARLNAATQKAGAMRDQILNQLAEKERELEQLRRQLEE